MSVGLKNQGLQNLVCMFHFRLACDIRNYLECWRLSRVPRRPPASHVLDFWGPPKSAMKKYTLIKYHIRICLIKKKMLYLIIKSKTHNTGNGNKSNIYVDLLGVQHGLARPLLQLG